MPVILAAGAAHLDRRGRAAGPFRLGASNPGRMRESVGGAAFNAARAMRALGAAVRLVSARGGDETGARVREAVAALGVEDLALTWLDRATPTYTALLDDGGELVAGLADMALYDMMQPRAFSRRHLREALASADALFLDANLPAASLDRLVEAAGAAPTVAVGVSPAKVGRLAGVLPRLAATFLSRAEAAQLVEVTASTRMTLVAELLRELGCRRAVITDGPRPAAILDGDAVLWQPPPPVASVRDVTGAGDTLAGVALVKLVEGLTFAEAARFGMAAASLHVSDAAPDFALASIRALAAEMPPSLLRHPEDDIDLA